MSSTQVQKSTCTCSISTIYLLKYRRVLVLFLLSIYSSTKCEFYFCFCLCLYIFHKYGSRDSDLWTSANFLTGTSRQYGRIALHLLNGDQHYLPSCGSRRTSCAVLIGRRSSSILRATQPWLRAHSCALQMDTLLSSSTSQLYIYTD